MIKLLKMGKRKLKMSKMFDDTTKWELVVRTKNPFLRFLGNFCGLLASFFMSIELKWGDVYELEFDDE
jgi:hypothetical protein